MMQVVLPWGLYVGALACAITYLQLLPDVFARRRLGVRGGGLADGAWWLCLIAIFALMAWPFFAAAAIDWDNDPSFLTILLMTFGAAAAGFGIHLVVQMIAGAYAAGLMADDDGPALITFGRTFSGIVAAGLVVLTMSAFWVLNEGAQHCLGSSYC